ncbi:MAG: PP2C family protein-serine/threonine phosphatase [Terriglobales bacterium]
MSEKTTLIRTLASPPLELFRRFFRKRAPAPPVLTDPLHSDVPALRQAEIAAIYHGQRVAGDFYEFLRVGASRVLFGLFDIAGRREDTREILIAAQRTFRTLAPELFAEEDINEPVAMIEISQQLNRTILRCAGVRSCPAFIGCYNEDLGTVCYANAGHTPGLLRDQTGITPLEATGLPLGLFSHTTRSASTCAMTPGAVLLLVSRGTVEAECEGEEFGLESTKRILQGAPASSAPELCLTILRAVQQFVRTAPAHNDVTALALVRGTTVEDLGLLRPKRTADSSLRSE